MNNTGEAIAKGSIAVLVWLIGAVVLVKLLPGLVDQGLAKWFADLLLVAYLFGFPLASIMLRLGEGMVRDLVRAI